MNTQILKTLTSLFKKYRPVLAALILVLTILVFVRFFATHRQYLTTLRHVQPWVILAIIGLNGLLTLVIATASQYTLQLCGKRIPFKEQLLLTAYSSMANFFGPLQSGPGVRAVYLKTKHQLRLRDYTLATLIGYGMFAAISALMMVGGSRPWWQAGLAFVIVGGLSIGVIRLFTGRAKKGDKPRLQLSSSTLGGLLLMTWLQVVIVTAYYTIELHAVAPHISLHQAITYAGAANFALFVSLTPDAIGIRESFLVLAKRLHHLSTAVILAANVIDRAAYALYVVLLFVIVMASHGRDRLRSIRQPAS